MKSAVFNERELMNSIVYRCRDGKSDGTLTGGKQIAMRRGAIKHLVSSDKWNLNRELSLQINVMKEMKLNIPQGYVKYYIKH